MRARLASMTRDDEQVPYWEAGNGRGAAHQNLLEKSFQRVNMEGNHLYKL